MELHECFTLERYRLATERQQYYTALARDAFAGYAKFVAVIILGGVALISARDSLGLDRAVMPDLIRVLAYVVTFLGIVAVVQIGFALVRWRWFRQVESRIDPGTPRVPPVWWLSDALYIVIVAGSVWCIWEAMKRSGVA